MATLTKKELELQEEDTYFKKYIFKNGQEYGLRFATPKDAELSHLCLEKAINMNILILLYMISNF